jgi:N-acetylglucosaminyl-diphospho-decaprenol L-rhamnosyltransferase
MEVPTVSAENGQIDLSVVIVNWNVAGFLERCLRSLDGEMARTRLACEVVVVDNCSHQRDFLDVVAGYPEVRLIELQENAGYGAACNVGIVESGGAAVLLLNPDAELLPRSLDLLWKTLHLSPEIGLVAPLLLNPDGTVQSMGYRFPGAFNVLCDLFPVPDRLYASSINGRVPPGNGVLPRAIDYALGAALLVRRAALTSVGGFDEAYFMYSEEVDLQRRLAESGWRRLLAPDARFIHYGGQSTSQRAAEMHEALWMSRAAYFDRWASARERRIIGLIADAGTRVDALRNPSRREANTRIRARFRASQSTLQ